MSTAVIVPILCTIFAGVGLKLVDLLWTRFNEGRLERKEAERRFEVRAQELQDKQLLGLSETLKSAQEELQNAENELTEWREKYFSVREDLLKQMAELQNALIRIKELENEVERYKHQGISKGN